MKRVEVRGGSSFKERLYPLIGDRLTAYRLEGLKRYLTLFEGMNFEGIAFEPRFTQQGEQLIISFAHTPQLVIVPITKPGMISRSELESGLPERLRELAIQADYHLAMIDHLEGEIHAPHVTPFIEQGLGEPFSELRWAMDSNRLDRASIRLGRAKDHFSGIENVLKEYPHATIETTRSNKDLVDFIETAIYTPDDNPFERAIAAHLEACVKATFGFWNDDTLCYFKLNISEPAGKFSENRIATVIIRHSAEREGEAPYFTTVRYLFTIPKVAPSDIRHAAELFAR